jgi:hypothetical protein
LINPLLPTLGVQPHNEIHAYMPGLGETQPFWDPQQLSITKQLTDTFEMIRRNKYHTLICRQEEGSLPIRYQHDEL